MGIALGPTQYAKAGNRIGRVYRDTDRNDIRDLTVSTLAVRRLQRGPITDERGDVLAAVFAIANTSGFC